MSKLKKFILYSLPPIVWAGVIFFFSSQQHVQVSTDYWENFAALKSSHVIGYSGLFILIHRALFNSTTYKKPKALAIAMLLTIAYAITDEIHQKFVPTRDGKWRDVIFDTIGASIALLIIWYILPNLPKKLRNWVNILQLT